MRQPGANFLLVIELAARLNDGYRVFIDMPTLWSVVTD